MPITTTVIRAGIRRSCSEQGELAQALGVPCDEAHGFSGPTASLEDVDIDAIADASGFRVADGDAYGDTYALRQRVTRAAQKAA